MSMLSIVLTVEELEGTTAFLYDFVSSLSLFKSWKRVLLMVIFFYHLTFFRVIIVDIFCAYIYDSHVIYIVVFT